jgi:predicted NAD-dependent protein-ADP-ribosyltransferase YbiA (DUF1768 family)
MPSQLNASAHYSVSYKEFSLRPVRLPIAGKVKDALDFFSHANASLEDFQPRKLARPANFNDVVHTVDSQFLVQCYGQLKGLGDEEKHGLCIYIVTNQVTQEKHGLIGFAGQGFSNFNGSNTRTYCKYTVCLFGEDADFKSVELRNPCSELGFQLAKAVSVYAAMHKRNKGEFCSFMDFNAIQKVLQSKSPKEAKLATNGTNMPIPQEEFDEVMGPWQDIAPSVMLRCLINKCGDLEFFGLIETLFNRCVELGVAPGNIRWAEIDPFGDAHWGVGLQSEKTCSILETAAVHLAKHGVDKFPGKNLMGQCLSDLVVLVRNPATGEFCGEDDLDEIFEGVDQEPFIQLVPRDVWTGDYFPKPTDADVGTSLYLPLQSDEEFDDGSQAAPGSLESSLWRPVTPDYVPTSPSYVPTSPTDARQDQIKAERIASATRRVRNLVGAFHTRTYSATDEGAEFYFQQRLIEDVEEFLAELKEACPVAAAQLERNKKDKLEREMQAPDEEASTTIGREIAMQLADELPEAIRASMRRRACIDFKNDVIRMAGELIKAVKMTHPLLGAGDILSDSDEEDRPAKRARQGSDDSYGRPASTSRVLHAAPGSPDEAPEDQIRRLGGDV